MTRERAELLTGQPVKFLRQRDYIVVRVLGRGACGETILLRDDIIDSEIVCKKYAPFDQSLTKELFGNFLREIKLLYEVHHLNVVRVFNHYVYPDQHIGYILMEYVEGQDIEAFLRSKPESVNSLFIQAIDGFAHIEGAQILHRDIRPQNILVREDGILKIIDLGFGKRVESSVDFDKSISLNWWCEPPSEFASGAYDHATEVYFVGKLFERLIKDNSIEQFKHASLVEQMCRLDPSERISSFFDVKTQLNLRRSKDIEFEYHEREAYRRFADAVSAHVTKLEIGAKYATDLDRIRVQLEGVFRSCMLEEVLADCAPVLRIFLLGQYYYRKTGFPSTVVKAFLDFLRSAPMEKQQIALANLHARLEAKERYAAPKFDDDIPF